MLALALLSMTLLQAGPDEARQRSIELAAGVEYSTFLDAHRKVASLYGSAAGASAFGPRVSLALRQGSLELATSATVYPSSSGVAVANDFFAMGTKQWSRLALLFGGGAGWFFTTPGTLVPTYSNQSIGPSIHARAHLVWKLNWRLSAEADVAAFLYPLQRFLVLPVGVDLRCSLGLALALDA